MIDPSLTWTEADLPHAIAALARATGLGANAVARETRAAAGPDDEREREEWVERMARAVGVDAEPVTVPYETLSGALRGLGPALVRLRDPNEGAYAAIVGTSRRSARVLSPTLDVARVPLSALAENLSRAIEAPAGGRVDGWLGAAAIAPRRRARSRRELLRFLLAGRPIGGVWLLRADPGSSFAPQLRRRAVARNLALVVATATTTAAMSVASWYVIGRGALNGVLEPGWLWAWALLSVASVLVQTATSNAAQRATLGFSIALKQRLLCGALRMDADAVRARGSGNLLAVVAESEAFEGASAAAALGLVTAIVQLAGAAFILALGAGGWLHVALLVAWTAVLVVLALRLARRRAAWTDARFALTNRFVEHVIGHRTRAVQQRVEQWHLGEDAELEEYVRASARMDASQASLVAASSRSWLAIALVGLVPALLSGAPSPASLAIAIGGILQAQGAFGAVVGSASSVLAALVSWRGLAPLFRAAEAREAPGVVDAPSIARRDAPIGDGPSPVILSAHGVAYRYAPDLPAVLRGCDLALRAGEHVLLEGRSGSGKSTLAAILSGARAADHGVVLLRGLDLGTVGASTWRHRVARAPQFHENHVFPGTLLFNLLLGRRWPAEPSDRKDADEVCRELGLGPLIDRMPSGLDQGVGETGWQLSHGERSRVFLARALLQDHDVVILDETFGAVDPLTLDACVGVARRRSRALLVIGHT